MSEQEDPLPNSLSDQAVVQLMSALMRKGILKDTVTTLDGKEWVTFPQLELEIQQHVTDHGGRLNILDLQALTNVDMKYIKTRIMVLVHLKKGEWTLLGDEILDNVYLKTISEEVNQSLQASGWLLTSQLCQKFNLPIHFFNRVLDDNLGTTIDGTADPAIVGIIYTQKYADEQKIVIKEAFEKLNRPTSVLSVQSSLKIPESLFYFILEAFIKEGAFKGSFRGRRENSSFTPDTYKNSQIASARSFADQNGYIEYQYLTKLAVTSPREFLRTHYPDLTLFSTCALSVSAIAAVEAAVEDAIQTESWVDVRSFLPTSLSLSDLSTLISSFSVVKVAVKTNDHIPVVLEAYVTTVNFIQNCASSLRPYLEKKAIGLAGMDEQDDEINVVEKEDERSTIKVSKGGSKKTSKKQASSAPKSSKGIIQTEVSKQLVLANPNLPDEFASLLAQYLHRQLSEQYEQISQSVFLPAISSTNEVDSSAHKHGLNPATKDQTEALQRRANELWDRVRLGNEGLSLFEDESARQSLSKHLLRTLCVELLDIILLQQAYVHGHESSITLPLVEQKTQSRLTEEYQVVLISNLPGESRAAAEKIKKLLSGKDTSEYLMTLQESASTWTDLTFKTGDDKQTLSLYRESLLTQLRAATSPPLILHLTVLLLFYRHTGTLLEASGKFVPKIIRQLQSSISDASEREKIMEKLEKLQSLIVVRVKNGGDGDDVDSALVEEVRTIGLEC